MASGRVDLIVQARDARASARDIRGVDSAVEGVGRSAERTSRRSRIADASARGLHKTFQSVATASKYGVVGIAALGASTVKTASSFEQSMSALGSATDAGGAKLALLRAQALKAGAATSFSASQAVEAQTELAKGGLSAGNILRGGLNSALALAAAGEMGLADAASTTANAMNLFGMTGRKAGHVADALATASLATTADVSDFSMALTQGGAAAKSAGLSFDQTVLGLEALAKAGVKGSDAGTSLKSMLTQIASPSKEAGAMMNQLGLDFFGANGQMKDLGSISGMLRSKLGNLTAEQRLQAATTLAGTDGMRGLLALYDAGPHTLSGFEKGLGRQGSAMEVARRKQDNLKGAVEQLGGSWETLKVIAGTALIPILTAGAQKATGLVNALSRSAQEGGTLSDVVQQFGAGIRGDLLTPMGGAAGAAQDLGVKFREAWPAVEAFVRDFDFAAAFDAARAAAGPLGGAIDVVTHALENPTVQQAAVAVIGLGVAYKGLNAVTGGAAGGLLSFAGGAGKATLATVALVTQIVAYRTAKMTLNAALVANTGATAANTTAQNVSTLTLIRGKAATIGHAVATNVAAGATKAWAVGQWLLNAAMTANPLALVIAAVAAWIAVIVVAYKKVGWFRAGVQAVWGALKSAWRWAASNGPRLLQYLPIVALIRHFGDLKRGASSAFNGIKSTASGALDWVGSKVAWVGDKITGLLDKLKKVPGLGGGLKVPGLGGLDLPGIPGLASGGVARQAGWAVVGERGPELRHIGAGDTVFDARQSATALAGVRSGQPPAAPLAARSSSSGGMDAEVLLAAVRAALEGVVLEVHSSVETDGKAQARSVRRVALKDAIVRSPT